MDLPGPSANMATLTGRRVFLGVRTMGGDEVDTATAIGKLLMTGFSAGIVEFEADLIRGRQRERSVAARAHSDVLGPTRPIPPRPSHALELLVAGDRNHPPVKVICAMTQVSRATVFCSAR